MLGRIDFKGRLWFNCYECGWSGGGENTGLDWRCPKCNNLETWEYNYLEKLNWVVVGCESGHNRRECKIEWIEDIVNQCKQANVPVFVKQIQIDGKVIKDIEKFRDTYRLGNIRNETQPRNND